MHDMRSGMSGMKIPDPSSRSRKRSWLDRAADAEPLPVASWADKSKTAGCFSPLPAIGDFTPARPPASSAVHRTDRPRPEQADRIPVLIFNFHWCVLSLTFVIKSRKVCAVVCAVSSHLTKCFCAGVYWTNCSVNSFRLSFNLRHFVAFLHAVQLFAKQFLRNNKCFWVRVNKIKHWPAPFFS